MTSPTNVGQVSVDLIIEARALAKQIRQEVEKSFKGLDMSKAIKDSVGRKPVKMTVDPDVDTTTIAAKVKGTRVPKIPVEVDPLLAQFQQQVRRQVASLGRQLNASIPVGADTNGLRAELGATLKAVQAQSRIEIPTEPGAKAEYEGKLKRDLDEVAARVKQTVRVNVDVDKGRGGLAGVGGLIKGLSGILPNFAGIASNVASLGGAIQHLAGSSAQLGGNLAGSFQSAAGPIGALVSSLVGLGAVGGAVFAGLAGAVTFVIPAVTALAGALASLPGLMTGVGAGVGTLLLGFKGISEAFKPKAGGGGGGAGNNAAQQGRQIASASRQVEAARRGITAANRGLEASERSLSAAQRGVASAYRSYLDSLGQVEAAQKRALATQQAISRARREATEDIEDLNRSLRGAAISEREAAQAVHDAELALNEAKLTGDIPSINRARDAYDRAVFSLEEAKDTTQDLGEASAEANAKGVEGSDKVQDALKDQADAYKAVKDAQQGVLDAQNGMIDAADSLKSAQDGVLAAQDSIKSAYDGLASAQDSLAQAQTKVAAGAGGVAQEVTKLAPAAQKFVDAIKALKPAFESLRLDVQQRLFQGLDKTVTNIGNAWIPALRVTLGSYADTFNQFFKNLGTSITTPKFISDMQAGAEGFRRLLETVGQSITSKLIPAFGALSKASAPFMEALGEELANIVTSFSDWVLAGERSGGLTSFFDRASQALHDIFDIGGVVFSIIGSIFEIITGSSPTSGQANPLQQFRDGLQKIADYLNDPANQQKIRDFIGMLQTALTGAIAVAAQVSAAFTAVRSALGGDENSSIWYDIGAGIITGIIAGVAAQNELVFSFFKAVFDGIVNHVKRMLGIKSPSTVFAAIGVAIMQGAVQGITSWLGNLLSAAGRIRTTVINAVAGAGSWLVNAGRTAISGLINGINGMFGNLRIIAGNARVYVQNALVNAGNWLYQHGRAVISGLINGISSMIGNLGSYLGSIGSFIQANKGPIDKDRKLLVGAGQAIMGGLITGIGDKKDALAAELADVTSLVANTALPSLGVEADAVSRSLSVADQKSMLLAWKTGSTGDQLLDAIAGMVDLRFNGNVQAALSRT